MPYKILVSLPVIFAITIVVILSYIVIGLSAYQRGQHDLSDSMAIERDRVDMIEEKQTPDMDYLEEEYMLEEEVELNATDEVEATIQQDLL